MLKAFKCKNQKSFSAQGQETSTSLISLSFQTDSLFSSPTIQFKAKYRYTWNSHSDEPFPCSPLLSAPRLFPRDLPRTTCGHHASCITRKPPRALRRDEVLLRGNEEGKIEAATLCSSTSRILPSEDFVSNFLPLPWGPFQGM